MFKSKETATFSKNFWESFNSLGIYNKSKSAESGLLGDMDDSASPGGNIGSDGKTDVSNEQNNDNVNSDGVALDPNGEAGAAVGEDTTGMDAGGGDSSGNDSGGGDAGDASGGNEEDADPNENVFKTINGKSELDSKLAELQAAITDSLQRIYSNPKITDSVVVSELENLKDSISKIRDTVYLVPIENTLYKYRLSTVSYALLSKDICIAAEKAAEKLNKTI